MNQAHSQCLQNHREVRQKLPQKEWNIRRSFPECFSPHRLTHRNWKVLCTVKSARDVHVLYVLGVYNTKESKATSAELTHETFLLKLASSPAQESYVNLRALLFPLIRQHGGMSCKDSAEESSKFGDVGPEENRRRHRKCMTSLHLLRIVSIMSSSHWLCFWYLWDQSSQANSPCQLAWHLRKICLWAVTAKISAVGHVGHRSYDGIWLCSLSIEYLADRCWTLHVHRWPWSLWVFKASVTSTGRECQNSERLEKSIPQE